MNIKIKKSIQGTVLELDISGESDKETLAKAIFFTEPDFCRLCAGEKIIWTSSQAKDKSGDTFTYIKRRCINSDCTATSTMGEYKGSKGFFWKKWEIYNPDGKNLEPTVNID